MTNKSSPDPSDAEVLDEMCRMQSAFRITRLADGKGLSPAEVNILKYKAHPLRSGAFRVVETVDDQDDIERWLVHPAVNRPWPDNFVMDMAAHTPIPVRMMDRVMRRLLGGDYEELFKRAKAQIMARREEH